MGCWFLGSRLKKIKNDKNSLFEAKAALPNEIRLASQEIVL